MANILIVDDDPIFCEPFSFSMKEMGHQCHVAETFFGGLQMARENDFDIVFLDVILPDANGIEGIVDFVNVDSSPELVIITGKGNHSGAEIALKNGAWDYLEKPPAYGDLKLLIKRALDFRKNKLLFNGQALLNREFIIGKNIKLLNCLDIVARAAKIEGSVLITGETGTGKELMAKAVHFNSKRAKHNFITVNCTNLPANLVDNLLFGHVKGVFTGAVNDSDGIIKQADKGTLFLDEIGDLPLDAQKSLLSVLQTKKYRPLGSKKEFICDFRVISATNKDLIKQVDKGLFRKDLYFRLVTYHIQLPKLRERLDDLKPLTNHYVAKICDEFEINTKGISKDFIDALMSCKWNGNVRELINVLHTTIANAINEPMIYPHHLPVDIRIQLCKQNLSEEKKQTTDTSMDIQWSDILKNDKNNFLTLKQFRKIADSVYLDHLIKISKGKPENAFRLADVSRSSFYQLLAKHKKKLKN